MKRTLSSWTRRPTIRDIAEISGFSIGTVDRALHNRRGIHPQTKRRILEVAQELGYEANRIASTLSRKRPLVLGAVFPRELHYFYDDIRQGFIDAAERLRNFKVAPLLRDVESLGKGEEEALRSLLEERIDGLVFAPGHRSRFNSFIDRFAERGIPVVTVSTDAPLSRRLTTVCVNPRKNGQLAGELMSHFVPEGGTVAVMVGSLDIEDHFQKVEGFKEAMVWSTRGIELVDVLENQEDERLAQQNFRKLLQRHPDLHGVYVATANSVAICQVLEDMAGRKTLKCITTDLFREMIPYLRKGVIHATIFQNPYRQSFEATMLLFRYLVEGVEPSTYSYLEPIVVMKSNLEFYC